jgi:hypothetical protein
MLEGRPNHFGVVGPAEGDMHADEKKCPPNSRCAVPIWTYLQNLFEQYKGNTPIDFFLEIDFAPETRKIRESGPMDLAQGNVVENFLVSMRIYFDNCFQKLKTQCQFYGKPIRFHYADVRSGVIHSGTDAKDQIIVKQFQDLVKIQDEKNPPKARDYELLLKFIDKFERGDIDYFFRLTKIDKQLAQLDKQEKYRIVRLLREYMETHIEREQDELIVTRQFDEIGDAKNRRPFRASEPDHDAQQRS